MKVLIVNTAEQIGGAAIAARRLMMALNNNGIKATMLVRDKQTDNPDVVPLRKSWLNSARCIWERIVIWAANCFKRHKLFEVDIANTGTNITTLPEFKDADIIHLHWFNQGMLSLSDLRKIIRSGKPIVWTMHDMWAFTGICHYADSCDRYKTGCRHCPKLYKGYKHDLSFRTFMKKKNILSNAHIHYVACSRWLESLARESLILRNQSLTNIPNAINTNLFHPYNKLDARQKLGLPAGRKLILFGSQRITDPRKGIKYLIEACTILQHEHPELSQHLSIVIMGKKTTESTSLFPFPIYNMGYVSEQKKMIEIYNAVDLYVTPSLQDNLPNTIVEAMACGTPCVGFQTGGIPQMIDHLHNGYVAEYQSATDLANGICWALADNNYAELSEGAYRKARSNYSEPIIARRYIKIYNKALDS